MRLALGAGRGQLAAQLLTESLVLALAAGAVGVLIAHWGARALVALVPRSVTVPGLADVGSNGDVLAFTLGVSVATALVFGLISRDHDPRRVGRRRARGAVARHDGDARRGGRRRRSWSLRSRWRSCCSIGAGLVLRSFAKLASVDPGFRVDHVMTVTVDRPGDRYRDDAARQAFYARAFAGAARAAGRRGGRRRAGRCRSPATTGRCRSSAPTGRCRRASGRPMSAGRRRAAATSRALQIPLLRRPAVRRPRSARQAAGRDRQRGDRERFFPGEIAVGRNVKLRRRHGGNRRRRRQHPPRGADATSRAPTCISRPSRVRRTCATWFVRTVGRSARARCRRCRRALRAIEPQTVFVEIADAGTTSPRESMQVTQPGALAARRSSRRSRSRWPRSASTA